MWVIYILLFFVLYVMHCLQAQKLLSYYTGKHWQFHLNLWKWKQDVRFETRSVD